MARFELLVEMRTAEYFEIHQRLDPPSTGNSGERTMQYIYLFLHILLSFVILRLVLVTSLTLFQAHNLSAVRMIKDG